MRGHLHHEYDSGYRTEFGIATAQQAADAWESGAQAATTKWATNLQQTTKPIVAAAIAQKAVAKANYAAAIHPGGWENALNAVGAGGAKSAGAAKPGSHGTGISTAKAKYLAKSRPVRPHIATGRW